MWAIVVVATAAAATAAVAVSKVWQLSAVAPQVACSTSAMWKRQHEEERARGMESFAAVAAAAALLLLLQHVACLIMTLRSHSDNVNSWIMGAHTHNNSNNSNTENF